MTPSEPLHDLAGPGRDWLATRLERPFESMSFRVAYAGCRRRLGPRHEVGRRALLLWAAEHLGQGEMRTLVSEVYLRGDNGEREALLRALCDLPTPESFAETAIEACRTNVVTIFESIACENAYPSTFFPDAAFDQMVLKALFLGVSARRILGMRERVTTETSRMCESYGSERRAAGRSVPDEIAWIAEMTR